MTPVRCTLSRARTAVPHAGASNSFDPNSMRLPSAEAVEIDVRKVRDYLLSPTHPIGRHKARVFAALGFDDSSVEAFISEIRRIAATGEVTRITETMFGRKYVVIAELNGTVGTVSVQTVWMQARGKLTVRLVTVIPRSL